MKATTKTVTAEILSVPAEGSEWFEYAQRPTDGQWFRRTAYVIGTVRVRVWDIHYTPWNECANGPEEGTYKKADCKARLPAETPYSKKVFFIAGQIVRETPRAYLLSVDDEQGSIQAWVPKSALDSVQTEGGKIRASVPSWLYSKIMTGTQAA